MEWNEIADCSLWIRPWHPDDTGRDPKHQGFDLCHHRDVVDGTAGEDLIDPESAEETYTAYASIRNDEILAAVQHVLLMCPLEQRTQIINDLIDKVITDE